jgi:hypothetical protein
VPVRHPRKGGSTGLPAIVLGSETSYVGGSGTRKPHQTPNSYLGRYGRAGGDAGVENFALHFLSCFVRNLPLESIVRGCAYCARGQMIVLDSMSRFIR